jgi:hypothetical protein
MARTPPAVSNPKKNDSCHSCHDFQGYLRTLMTGGKTKFALGRFQVQFKTIAVMTVMTVKDS